MAHDATTHADANAADVHIAELSRNRSLLVLNEVRHLRMQTAFERLLKMMRAGAALSLHRQDAHGFACCCPAR